MSDAMQPLPTAREALARAINWANQADALMARLWLDIARELREGACQERSVPMEVRMPIEPLGLSPEQRAQSNLSEALSPVRKLMGEAVDRVMFGPGANNPNVADTVVIKAQQEKTEVIRPLRTAECAACRQETFIDNGRYIHRSTYRVECEPALSAR